MPFFPKLYPGAMHSLCAIMLCLYSFYQKKSLACFLYESNPRRLGIQCRRNLVRGDLGKSAAQHEITLHVTCVHSHTTQGNIGP